METCSKCGKQFTRKGMAQHQKRKIPCDRKLECKKCGKIFKHIGDFKRHCDRKTPCDPVIINTSIVDNVCLHCGRSFSTKGSLTRHYLKCKTREAKSMRDDIKEYKTEIFDLKNELKEHKKEIKDLKNELKELKYANKKEIKELKAAHAKELAQARAYTAVSPPEDNKSGFIYVIQPREFVNDGENIYKIGRTCRQADSRLLEYPKHSRVYYTRFVNNCHEKENAVKQHLKNKFIQRTDLGATELFQGDITSILKEIQSVLAG